MTEVDSGNIPEELLAHYEALGAVFFPRLEILAWRESDGLRTTVRSLQQLISPAVSNILLGAKWNWGFDDNLFAPEISVLAERCSKAKHLDVVGSLTFSRESYQCLRDGFRNLHSVSVFDLNRDLFVHFGSLPNLNKLSVTIISCLYHSDEEILPPRSYTALHHLSFGTITPEQLRRLLLSLSSSPLTELDVTVNTYCVPFARGDLNFLHTSDVIRALDAFHLRIILLDTMSTPNDDPSTTVVIDTRTPLPFEHVLSFLLPIKHLHSLIVWSAERPLVVSDEDLHAIARTWPRLHSLGIQYYSFIEDRISRPSLSAVVSLAITCRKLWEVDVEIADVSHEELARLKLAESECIGFGDPLARVPTDPQRSLEVMTFARRKYRRHLGLSDVDALARCLRKMFPRLRGLSPSEAAGWSSEERETDLYRLLTRLQDF